MVVVSGNNTMNTAYGFSLFVPSLGPKVHQTPLLAFLGHSVWFT